MKMSLRRALHFVFKIANRNETMKFYRDILGMKVLRHEEFEEGCKASCNGPYDGKWSKTMTGFGPEDDHFVVELTYNYGIKTYQLGNDFQGITVHSKTAVSNAKQQSYPVTEEGEGCITVKAPGGYKFTLVDQDVTGDPVRKVSLVSFRPFQIFALLAKLVGDDTVIKRQRQQHCLVMIQTSVSLNFIHLGHPVDHATAFGRIAFSLSKQTVTRN
ncbi:glyoxalase domain-containing protein 4-like [Stylophora pistillata]|uniref:glyoxalase domain-containing protein 4-like n=1 Tax=Stylophora pistillata TaxID=50429 RepID=UPI000C049129|nr:glyoxalase domain-containing protein 4-like [Stylophora pistillata]